MLFLKKCIVWSDLYRLFSSHNGYFRDTGKTGAGRKRKREAGMVRGRGAAFLGITPVFISPPYSVTGLHSDMISQEMNPPGREAISLWGHIKAWYRIDLMCSVLLFRVARYRPLKRLEWKSARLGILVIWLTGPASAIVAGLYFYLMFPPFFDRLVRDFPARFIRPFPYPLIRTSCPLISKRVRNTYMKTVGKPSVVWNRLYG